MPFGMGFGELVLILIIVMVVFGGTRLPGAGDWLGRWMRGFDPRRASFSRHGSRRWTAVDWLLVGTTAALAATLAVSYASGR